MCVCAAIVRVVDEARSIDRHRGSVMHLVAENSLTNGFANSPIGRMKCNIGAVVRSPDMHSAALGKHMGSRGSPSIPQCCPQTPQHRALPANATAMSQRACWIRSHGNPHSQAAELRTHQQPRQGFSARIGRSREGYSERRACARARRGVDHGETP